MTAKHYFFIGLSMLAVLIVYFAFVDQFILGAGGDAGK